MRSEKHEVFFGGCGSQPALFYSIQEVQPENNKYFPVDFLKRRYYNNDNTLMRRVGRETCQREAHCLVGHRALLEVLSWEAFENYLGVAPIRPGGRRYRQNEAGKFLI